MTRTPIDLGGGHKLRYTSWTPDRELNPQYADDPDVPRWGAILVHPAGPHPMMLNPSGECEGAITFDGPMQRKLAPDTPRWTVVSWEPLTLSPSILCACGVHGHIREGRWVPA